MKLRFTALEQVNNGDELIVINSVKPGSKSIGRGDCINQAEVPWSAVTDIAEIDIVDEKVFLTANVWSEVVAVAFASQKNKPDDGG